MDLKIILLLICSIAIFEKVNGLEEERILLRLSQVETGLESCNKKNDEYAIILNETKDILQEHTESLHKANNEITRLKKFAVGTSCSQLASLGFDLSDNYFLDYDGFGQGHPPFKALYMY